MMYKDPVSNQDFPDTISTPQRITQYPHMTSSTGSSNQQTTQTSVFSPSNDIHSPVLDMILPLPIYDIPQYTNDTNVVVSGLKVRCSSSSMAKAPSQTIAPFRHLSQTSTHGMITSSKYRSYANVLMASTADISEPTNVYIALQEGIYTKRV